MERHVGLDNAANDGLARLFVDARLQPANSGQRNLHETGRANIWRALTSGDVPSEDLAARFAGSLEALARVHALEHGRVVVHQGDLAAHRDVEGVVHAIVVRVVANRRDEQRKLVLRGEAFANLLALGQRPVAALEDAEAVPHVVVRHFVVLRHTCTQL